MQVTCRRDSEHCDIPPTPIQMKELTEVENVFDGNAFNAEVSDTSDRVLIEAAQHNKLHIHINKGKEPRRAA